MVLALRAHDTPMRIDSTKRASFIEGSRRYWRFEFAYRHKQRESSNIEGSFNLQINLARGKRRW